MIVYFSDFNLQGSGYKNVGVPLVEGLVERGHDVMVFGMGYRGEPHPFNFKLCPAAFQQIPRIMRFLPQFEDIEIDCWIVAFDIPLQLGLLQKTLGIVDKPWIGIFPVEGDPLCETWAMRLMQMDRKLVISVFGTEEANRVGLGAIHLPIGVDLNKWNFPNADERRLVRSAMELEDQFVVLTIADNQERKNLARSMEIFAAFAKDHDATYLMVTRQNSPVGWVLHDYAKHLGFADRFMVWERGIPDSEIRDLFVVADAFLLTSKAEGLGMPVLEAMAMGVPVAATDCTAIHDHIKNEQGFPIEFDYVFVDPWGNSNRYMASIKSGVAQLEKIWLGKQPNKFLAKRNLQKITENALEYVTKRKWSHAVDVLEEAIHDVT